MYKVSGTNDHRTYDELGVVDTEWEAESLISEIQLSGRPGYRSYYYYYEPVQLIGEQDDVAIQN